MNWLNKLLTGLFIKGVVIIFVFIFVCKSLGTDPGQVIGEFKNSADNINQVKDSRSSNYDTKSLIEQIGKMGQRN